jgi:hypothetical protein
MLPINFSNDFYLEVVRGTVTNFTTRDITGVNAAVGGTEDVWNMGGAHTAGATAAVVHISSSSAADITQSVTVTGLDANYDEISETIALNATDGQTETSGSTLFLKVNSATLSAVAAGAVYVYFDDTVTAGVPQTQAKIQAKIEIGALSSTSAFYTVPRNKNLYLTSFRYRSTGSTTANDVILTINRTLYGSSATVVETIKYKDLGTTNFIDDQLIFVDRPILFPAKSFFKVTAGLAGGTALNLTVEAKFIEESITVAPSTVSVLTKGQYAKYLSDNSRTISDQDYWLIGLDAYPTTLPTTVDLNQVLCTIAGDSDYAVTADTEVAFDPAYYTSGKLVVTTKPALVTIMKCTDSSAAIRYVLAPTNTLVSLKNTKKIKFLAIA